MTDPTPTDDLAPRVAAIERGLHTGVCGPDGDVCSWANPEDEAMTCAENPLTSLATHLAAVLREGEAGVRATEETPLGDHPHVDPGDGRTECYLCGKFIHEVIHSCKGMPVTRAAEHRVRALIDAVRADERDRIEREATR